MDQKQETNVNTFEFMFNLYQKSQRNMTAIFIAIIVGLVATIIYQNARYEEAVDKMTTAIQEKKQLEQELSDANAILAPIQERIDKGASYIHKRHKVPMDAAQRFAYREMVESLNSGMPFIVGLVQTGKESGFKPRAISYTGCCYGQKQIHLKIWRQEKPGLTLNDLYDPDRNTAIGYEILREYYDKTGSVVGALKRYYGSTVPEDNVAYAEDVMRRAREAARYINT